MRYSGNSAGQALAALKRSARASSTGVLVNEAPLQYRDNTRQSPERQFEQLTKSCARIQRSLQRAAIARPEQVPKLAGLLSNQMARLHAISDKLAEASTLPTKPFTPRILPDLSAPARLARCAPVSRFSSQYVNAGKVHKPKFSLEPRT